MTEEAQAGAPVRMPKTTLAAVIGLWLHTIVSLLGMVVLFLDAKSMADHNQENAGAYAIGGAVSLAITGLFGLASVAVKRRQAWGRELAYFLEIASLIIVAFLLVVAVGIAKLDPMTSLDSDLVAVPGVLWVLLPTVIVVLLALRPTARWLERRPY